MTMTYNTLVAPKGAAGSIANWVSYTKLDTATIVDEAQSLIYQILRVREMRQQWAFSMEVGEARVALPPRFLDPIGDLTDNFGGCYSHSIESEVKNGRAFDATISGTLGIDPFTSGSIGTSTVTANLPSHGLTQESDITIAGSGAVDGITVNGTRIVTGVIDADNFTFEGDGEAVIGNIHGGAEDATYVANPLISGSPSRWSIWDESLQFDSAFAVATQLRLMVYKSLPLLSLSKPTNFLTARYPVLMRKACQASAADFMKDDVEYKKSVEGLSALIQSIAAADDLSYRGAEFGTDTP